jgi:hypothetical protein
MFLRIIITTAFIISFLTSANAQKAEKDSPSESFAIGEIGPAASLNIKGGKSSYGYSIAVETTPIENWLELELGVTPTYASHLKEIDVDFLFKKPWTLSPKLEFMLGVGPVWEHETSDGITTNEVSGEVALDFMDWPFKKRQFGFYFEPEYDYSFKQGHEQSVGLSGGLLIGIP